MDGLVVGFDLDMTLVDSRAAFLETMRMLGAETGAAIDGPTLVAELGTRLELVLGRWLPPEAVDAAADRFRVLYRVHGVPRSRRLPGAAEALDHLAAAGGAAVVVTGKYEPNARAELAAVGLAVPEVVGWHWGAMKGEALRRLGATVYVGDTPGDVEGARAAGALAVGVATGAHPAAALAAAGADVVLTSLEDLPDVLVTRAARRAGGPGGADVRGGNS